MRGHLLSPAWVHLGAAVGVQKKKSERNPQKPKNEEDRLHFAGLLCIK